MDNGAIVVEAGPIVENSGAIVVDTGAIVLVKVVLLNPGGVMNFGLDTSNDIAVLNCGSTFGVTLVNGVMVVGLPVNEALVTGPLYQGVDVMCDGCFNVGGPISGDCGDDK